MLDKKMYYNTILSSTFSPCGGYLLAGSLCGDIALYDIKCLSTSLAPAKSELQEIVSNKPKYYFKSQNELQVCSIISTENFFITGTIGEISGWDWHSVISGNPKVSWTIKTPSNKNTTEKPEINYMVTNQATECSSGMVLYAGCGDNNVYAFSLEDGKCLRTYEGHTNYLHCISATENKLASASEDGTVKIWDPRSLKVIKSLNPSGDNEIKRKHLGKWMGAVCIKDNWLVCGGGPKLSLWHLNTMSPYVTYTSTQDNGIHVVHFCEERILAGGCAPFFSELYFNIDVLCTKIETSSNTIYSSCYLKSTRRMMALGGSSNKIDLCTNLNFRDLVLTFN